MVGNHISFSTSCRRIVFRNETTENYLDFLCFSNLTKIVFLFDFHTKPITNLFSASAKPLANEDRDSSGTLTQVHDDKTNTTEVK